MSKYFLDILKQLEERKPHGWIQISSIIYRIHPNEQIEIINLLKQIKNDVKSNWKIANHTNVLNYIPPKSSIYAFSFVVFCNENKEQRQNFLENAMNLCLENKHIKYCLGIGINIDSPDMPYATICLSKQED
jgi:hypothetical protein